MHARKRKTHHNAGLVTSREHVERSRRNHEAQKHIATQPKPQTQKLQRAQKSCHGGSIRRRKLRRQKTLWPVASKKVMFTTPKGLRLRNFSIRGKVDFGEVR